VTSSFDTSKPRAAWVVLQALLTTAVFTLYFSRLGGLGADLCEPFLA
jgi:hypothetical protein